MALIGFEGQIRLEVDKNHKIKKNIPAEQVSLQHQMLLPLLLIPNLHTLMLLILS